jgi:phosphonate transport system permease protein
VPVIGEYFYRMAPPKWEFAEVLWKPAAETLYIALWGNVIALLIGLPLGVLAASNVTRSPLVRHSARAVLNLLRSISELIWAVFFVAAVLGRSRGSTSANKRILGRLYAEALENIDPGPVEALQATGASRLQVIAYAMFPQALPQFVTYNLYWFEVGVRSATVLGMVGAGGIGFELVTTIRLFEWRETGVVLLLILAMVTIIDLASTWIRARIY